MEQAEDLSTSHNASSPQNQVEKGIGDETIARRVNDPITNSTPIKKSNFLSCIFSYGPEGMPKQGELIKIRLPFGFGVIEISRAAMWKSKSPDRKTAVINEKYLSIIGIFPRPSTYTYKQTVKRGR